MLAVLVNCPFKNSTLVQEGKMNICLCIHCQRGNQCLDANIDVYSILPLTLGYTAILGCDLQDRLESKQLTDAVNNQQSEKRVQCCLTLTAAAVSALSQSLSEVF